MIKNGSKKHLINPFSWIVFLLYLIIAGYAMTHHELWGDEIHSWNIAKASKGFFDLISNTRYEGHPPVWYIVLWTISKFTHDPAFIQIAHLIIACLVVFIILFYSPFTFFIKLLIPFGYFFLFEYSILSRNYAIGVLIALCICVVMYKNFKVKLLLYYALLFLLSNTHLLALLLGISFHLYFLLVLKETQEKYNSLFVHLALGIVILLPAVYFIFPPSDSSLSANYWLDRWNINQLSSISQAPLRAFAPIPAWWEYNYWDTQFIIAAGSRSAITKWLTPIFSFGFVLLVCFLLKKNKKSLYFFLFNFLLIILVSFILPFTNSRHIGFIFIGFIIAFWFYSYQQSISTKQNIIVLGLLLLQIIGAIISISKDIRFPFSNGYKVKELLNEIPEQNKTITDYWCLNTLSAFTDRSFYCVDLQKEASYLLWNNELTAALKKSNRYSSGITVFLKKESKNKAYMISIHPPQKLFQLDDWLPALFNIKLIDKREGAIERGGNLYLYEITSL